MTDNADLLVYTYWVSRFIHGRKLSSAKVLVELTIHNVSTDRSSS